MNKIISFIKLFIILLFFSGSLFAQVTQDWAAIYNGPGNGADRANSIAVDGSGNVYVTGGSIGNGTSFDYVTIKYNSAGAEQWTARYNGPGNSDDWAYSIAVDGLGNVYVTGGSRGSGTFDDYATIKYNSAGVEQWVQRYNGTGNGNDAASSIAVDGSGNVYVTGQTVGSGTFDDYTTIKYNTDGVWQWGQIYNGTGNSSDVANSIAVDGSGNVYVTGRSTGDGTSSDYVTIKYNTDGAWQWGQLYNGLGNGYDEARSLAVDGSGNVYVTGGSMGSGTGTADYATIKYNSDGDGQWLQTYNGPGNSSDIAYSIAVDGSGNVYVTGRSWGNASTGEDYATLKYNSAGAEQWTTTYNGTGNGYDYAYSIAVDGSGNAYVTGRSLGNGTGSDYATIKYNSSGIEEWTAIYNGPGNNYDWASSIAVDGSGKVYVTGQSTGSGPDEDYATIKYSQPIGIKPISTEIPNAYKLLQNYPNPFNPTTKIRFAIPKSSFAILVVYDALGRETETLVNEQLNAGTYEVDWNAGKFSSGVYYYKIQTTDFSQTKKMILIK
jgi:uncharacterized delta-60 repeat protein